MTDLQIIDKLMGLMYGDGKYQTRVIFDPVPGSIDEAQPHEVIRVVRKMESLGILKKRIDIANQCETIELEDIGMEIMKEYGSYSKYLEAQKEPNSKKDRIEKTDRRVKNVGILATVILSLLTLFVTQYNRWQDKRQTQKQGISPAMEAKIDSLLKVLPPSKIDTPKQSKADTATNK